MVKREEVQMELELTAAHTKTRKHTGNLVNRSKICSHVFALKNLQNLIKPTEERTEYCFSVFK